jgi:membrane protease YdiL (CAAX protease family)
MVMLRASIPALWVVFLFAAAEELGWRGFALPELLRHNSAVKATLIVGGIHALWHWPLILLPKMWLSDIPVLPWTISVLAEAFVLTWIIRGTGGSVMLAALFHGMTNLAMLIFGGITPHRMPWLKAESRLPPRFACCLQQVLILKGSRIAAPTLLRLEGGSRAELCYNKSSAVFSALPF